jgi:phosphoribosylanthranilate isomerase
MPNARGVSVKVCCIQNESELRLAAEAGASHVGLVGGMPSGPGPLPDAVIRRIAASAPPGVTTVLLTAKTEADRIADHVAAAMVQAVQIVQYVDPEVRSEVRERVPGVQIFQVVHVEGPRSMDEAAQAAEGADFILLDSGRRDEPVAELGGTGRTHDWNVSAEIVAQSPVPVFLAGGLGPANVADAIYRVRPYGVDVCSGLRGRDTKLDPMKLWEFSKRLGEA